MTVIEAFSLGKPVIATDIGFMHEAMSAVGMNTVFRICAANMGKSPETNMKISTRSQSILQI